MYSNEPDRTGPQETEAGRSTSQPTASDVTAATRKVEGFSALPQPVVQKVAPMPLPSGTRSWCASARAAKAAAAPSSVWIVAHP
jgi:hypothetical protein